MRRGRSGLSMKNLTLAGSSGFMTRRVGLAPTRPFSLTMPTCSQIQLTLTCQSDLSPIIFAPSFGQSQLLPSNRLQLTLPGQIGHAYWIESSSDLKNWSLSLTVTNYTGTPLLLNFPINLPHQFYRALIPPVSCAER